MAKIDSAIVELREMDELAALKSPVHSLHPLAKLIVTIAYIFTVASFNKYNLSGLVIMILYPAFMFSVSGVSIKTCFYKLRLMLPLVCAVGLFNPIFDHSVMLYLGNIPVTGGWISFITLLLKGVFCLTASFILVATTTIDSICAALRKVHVPEIMVTLILLTFRYITVMIEEVSIMTTAYMLRAPGQKGIHYKAWGSFLGQLLLRSMDRAEELYASMKLRGFRGEFWYAENRKMKGSDWLFMVILVVLFIVFRYVNIAELIGGIAYGGIL